MSLPSSTKIDVNKEVMKQLKHIQRTRTNVYQRKVSTMSPSKGDLLTKLENQSQFESIAEEHDSEDEEEEDNDDNIGTPSSCAPANEQNNQIPSNQQNTFSPSYTQVKSNKSKDRIQLSLEKNKWEGA